MGEIRSDSESSDMTMVIIVIEIKSVGMMLKKNILLMDRILHHQGWWLSHYLQGFNHPRWCRISSINCICHHIHHAHLSLWSLPVVSSCVAVSWQFIQFMSFVIINRMALRSQNAYILMYSCILYRSHMYNVSYTIYDIYIYKKIDDIKSIIFDTSFVFYDIHDVLQKIRIIYRLVTVYNIYIYIRILIMCLLYIRDICFVPSGIAHSLPVHRSKQQGPLNGWNYLWSPAPQDPWDDCIFTYICLLFHNTNPLLMWVNIRNRPMDCMDKRNAGILCKPYPFWSQACEEPYFTLGRLQRRVDLRLPHRLARLV